MERTLPGWLRDVRRASTDEKSLTESGDSAQIEPPSVSPTDFLAGLSNLGDEEEETPDWLKNLQGTQPSSLARGKQEPALPFEPVKDLDASGESEAVRFDENDDPLSVAARSSPVEPTSNDSDTGQALHAELPDWLAELVGKTGEATPPLTESLPQEQQPTSMNIPPDWLSNLGGELNIDEPFSLPATGSAGEAERLDWLSSLGGPSTPAVPAGPASAQELLPASSSVTDWLSNLGGPSTPAVPTEPASTQEPMQTSGSVTDWLSSLDGLATPAVPTEPASTQEPPQITGGVTAWLSSLQGSSTPMSAESASTQEPAQTAGGVTGRPSMEGSLIPVPEEPGSAQEPPQIAGGVTAWLSSIEDSSTPEPVRPDKNLEAPQTPDGTMDWLSKLEYPSTPATPEPVVDNESSQSASSIPSSAMPDWMQEALSVDSVEQSAVQPATFQPGFVDMPAVSDEDNELPAWMLSADETPQDGKTVQENSSISAAQPVQPQIESNVASTVDAESIPAPVGEKNVDSILAMEAPDWLSGFNQIDSDQAPLPGNGEPPVDNLTQVELPSWVQAMRPVESVMEVTGSDDGEDQEVENDGPLAGLRSVLPIQAGFVSSRIPQTHSTKLIVGETQQAHATLLENLLISETSPAGVKRSSRKTDNRFIRWIVAAVLLLTMLAVAVLGKTIFPEPVETGPVGVFIKTVANLPAGIPVLMVVDYQPGFAGEIESAAGPAMEQLGKKQTPLVFVSSSPLGNFLADRLLQKSTELSSYQENIQYVYLGYLPGGAGGIKAFAEQPMSTLGQDTLSGNLWNTPVLSSVTVNSDTRLQNFAALIVLTDNPDTGRLWIEQARTLLGPKPMLMVVSAQAEPMLRPYLLSNQLTGLVSGLEGGMIYESSQRKPGLARSNWDVFGTGMLVAEFVILLGGAWSLIINLRARRASMEKDEA